MADYVVPEPPSSTFSRFLVKLRQVAQIVVNWDAPEDSLVLTSTGAGFGTATPDARVHALESGADAYVEVETGLTNGSAGIRLQGDARLWRVENDADEFVIYDATGAEKVLRLTAGADADAIFVDAAGRVGLSTTSVGERLVVYGDAAGSGSRVCVQNRDTSQAAGSTAAVDFTVGGNGKVQARIEAAKNSPASGAAGHLSLSTRKADTLTQWVRITSDGLVGVNGNTSPATALDLADGACTFKEMSSAPSTPGTGEAALWLEDNGAGKSRLRIKYDDGSVQTISVQA